MNVQKYEFYFECWQGYFTSWAKQTSEIHVSCSTWEIISYLEESMYMYVIVITIKILLLTYKNRTVDPNATVIMG